MSIPEALLMSLLGFCIVFVALFALYVLIQVMTLAVRLVQKKRGAAQPAPSAASDAHVSAAQSTKPAAPIGVDLIGVEPREAACIMAIVSDECGIPLNELRFISITALN